MKKIAASLLAGIVVATSAAGYSEEISRELSDNIVRLHIVANSNSEEDQAVKMRIRDAVLSEMEKCESVEDAKKSVKSFEKTANEVLKNEGFDYTAKAKFGRFDFPTKRYDNFALPKGEYDAVKIELGEAEGENWWCVLFPPLCLIDGTTEESRELLRETFGKNYEVVANDGKMPMKIKFKIAELF